MGKLFSSKSFFVNKGIFKKKRKQIAAIMCREKFMALLTVSKELRAYGSIEFRAYIKRIPGD